MLDTLYQIGQHLSKDSSRLEFDDIIATPPIDEKEKAKGLEFFVAEVIFDLDAGTFRLNDKPVTFDDSDKTGRWSPYNLRCVKNLGANAKNVYPTVDPRKHFDQWKKTFFGKEDKKGNKPTAPELSYSIQKDCPELGDTLVCRAATEIFKMREAFEGAFPEWEKVTKALNWGDKSRIAMLFASIIWTDIGYREPVPVAKLEGFDDFIRIKWLRQSRADSPLLLVSMAQPKLCYITGATRNDVEKAKFMTRRTLTKMYTSDTYLNYASDFDSDNFSKNYQASIDNQQLIECGGIYVLENLKVRIAGVEHCILPQFRGGRTLNFEDQTTKLKKESELLFLLLPKGKFSQLAHEFRTIADDEIYWITFLGIERDDKSLKSINQIKDISKTHFESVIKVLRDIDNEMSEIAGKQWTNAMTYGNEKKLFDFNFYTIYTIIPVRVNTTPQKEGSRFDLEGSAKKEAKDKRNPALALFKAILERRQISAGSIFQHFTELIQLHRFGRGGYNISPMSKDYFDNAIRDAVFQYLAFFQFLKKIKLLDMEEKTTSSAATLEEKNAAIAAFFERMGYSADQQAVFYLGQILNNVGYAQFKKDHESKPILGKVNYNGMDAAALKRLHADLFEKCRQYDILKFNEGNFSKIVSLFDAVKNEIWDKRMKPEESLFFLLSGYSFRAPGEEKEEVVLPETEFEN